jgi:hypothetical protein
MRQLRAPAHQVRRVHASDRVAWRESAACLCFRRRRRRRPPPFLSLFSGFTRAPPSLSAFRGRSQSSVRSGRVIKFNCSATEDRLCDPIRVHERNMRNDGAIFLLNLAADPSFLTRVRIRDLSSSRSLCCRYSRAIPR